MSDTIETTSGATSYVILRFNADTDEWKQYGDRLNSPSAHSAIRNFLTSRPGEGGGTYVAVPARSWKPVTVRAEQTVTLRIEEAT